MIWRALYPLVIVGGLTIAYWQLRKRYKKSPLSEQERVAVGLAAFVGAMLGAKLPFLLAEKPMGAASWLWLADGKTILGGIFGGYTSVELTKICLGIKFRTGDHFAAPVAIAIAFGRLGCFVGGCCYGQITSFPWGIHFPLAGDSAHVLRHPTQLYEAAFHSVALGCILLCERRGWLGGRRLTVYLLSYLVYRFVTEWIRPETVTAIGLTSYQIACIVLFLLLVVAERVNRHVPTQALSSQVAE